MGALPKRKTSKGRKNRRRSHHSLKSVKTKLTIDPKTGELVVRHRVNPKTGEYRGKKIINVD